MFYHLIPPTKSLPPIFFDDQSGYIEGIPTELLSSCDNEHGSIKGTVVVFFQGRGYSGHKFRVDGQLTEIQNIDFLVLMRIVEFLQERIAVQRDMLIALGMVHLIEQELHARFPLSMPEIIDNEESNDE